MAYLTANQVDAARAKAADFGEATLYLLPEPEDDPGAPYSDALCIFADKPFAIIIRPDGKRVSTTASGKKVSA